MTFIRQLKAKTKPFRNNLLYSKGLFYRLCRPVYKTIMFGYYLCSRHEYLSDKLTLLRYSENVIQPNSYTTKNRYPDLFNICRNHFVSAPAPHILSFGCSSGEEVISLSHYLPNARITGVDINHANLRKCRKKFANHSQYDFKHSLSDEFRQLKNFDAIFCLAVLQHTENRNPNTMKAVKFNFSRFEEILTALDQKLKTGGLFFIDQTDFNFLDTNIASKYTPLTTPDNQFKRDRPLFDRNDLKFSGESDLYRVFQKIYP